MRIIAGEFRGRRILSPATEATRPVTDRVKQSLFDILSPRIEGARVYDCFAGTGSMGLEALSRGARRATFFESDRSAAARLRRNIAELGVRDRSAVVDRDLFRWFETNRPRERAELVFLDPPYRFVVERADELRRLSARIASDHLKAEGIVIFRHDGGDALELPELMVVDRRKFGSMALEFLRGKDLEPPMNADER